MTEEVIAMVGWWNDWKLLGLLPWPGAIGDQPAFVVEVLTICENEIASIQSEKLTNG